jgi:hypothetical protein
MPQTDSCVETESAGPWSLTSRADRHAITFANPCAFDGEVEAYVELGTDPTESANPDGLDVVSVGLRNGALDSPDYASCPGFITFAITTEGPRRVPADTEFRVFIDTNGDRRFDRVAFNVYAADEADRLPTGSYAGGLWYVAHAPLARDTTTGVDLLEPAWSQVHPRLYPMPFRLDESTARLPVCASDLGLRPDQAFDFAVRSLDFAEDYPLTDDFLGYDHAPDGLEDGDRYRYTPEVAACLRLTDGGGDDVGGPFNPLTVPARGTVRAFIGAACLGPLHADATVAFVQATDLTDDRSLIRSSGRFALTGRLWLPTVCARCEHGRAGEDGAPDAAAGGPRVKD